MPTLLTFYEPSPFYNPIMQSSIISRPIRSQIALDELASFEHWITTFQGLPSIDRSNLDTDHVLVSVLGGEISDCLCALFPRVPDYRVLQVISDDVEAWLAIYEDRCSVLLERFVDSVCLTLDLEFVPGSVVFGHVENFVIIPRTCEASDSDFIDVLVDMSAMSPFPQKYYKKPYWDPEIGVRKHLELKSLLALVPDTQHGPQTRLAQRHAVL